MDNMGFPKPAGGFSGGSVVMNLLANAGDSGDVHSVPGLGRSPGGGHGNLLHCSFLENPMDRGTWQATVHGVAKSQAQPKWLSTHTHKPAGDCILLGWLCMFYGSLTDAALERLIISDDEISEWKYPCDCARSRLTLCNCMDHSLPGSSV